MYVYPADQQSTETRVSIGAFLDPYLNPAGGSKQKQIPEWIFNVPEVTRQELDSVRYFNLAADDTEDSAAGARSQVQSQATPALHQTPQSHHMVDAPRRDSAAGDESLHSRKGALHSVRHDASFPHPSQPSPNAPLGHLLGTQPVSGDFPGIEQTDPYERSEEHSVEEDMRISLPRELERKRILDDPLAFPSSPIDNVVSRSSRANDEGGVLSAQEDPKSDEDDDDDEDAHSAYSRSRRNAQRLPTQQSIEDMEMVEEQSSPVHPNNVAVHRSQSDTHSQSFSASQRSTEEFSLSRYQPTGLSDQTRILVQESDETTYRSAVTSSESHHLHSSHEAIAKSEKSPDVEPEPTRANEVNTPLQSVTARHASDPRSEQAHVQQGEHGRPTSTQDLPARARSSFVPVDDAPDVSGPYAWPDNFPPPPSPDLLPARYRNQFTPVMRKIVARGRDFTPQLVGPDSPLSIGPHGAARRGISKATPSLNLSSPSRASHIRRNDIAELSKPDDIGSEMVKVETAAERQPSPSPEQQDGDSDLDALEALEDEAPPKKKSRARYQPKLGGFRPDLRIPEGVKIDTLEKARSMLRDISTRTKTA